MIRNIRLFKRPFAYSSPKVKYVLWKTTLDASNILSVSDRTK